VKLPRLSRRQFLATLLVAAPAALFADARWIEPNWLQVRRLRLSQGAPTHRIVHFTDLHHKGDRGYLQSVVDQINAEKPDCVCFTGDLVEEGQHLEAALAGLARIQAPLFGVPGNHDYWSRISFAPIKKCFAATGGAWLLNQQQVLADGRLNLLGITTGSAFNPLIPRAALQPRPGLKNILLMHYPAWAKKLAGQKFDLLLAGHSHGGQVRIPFYGALVTPFGVDEYDLGRFDTPAGPLYVGAGIGWFHLNLRFNCRPEITVIEV